MKKPEKKPMYRIANYFNGHDIGFNKGLDVSDAYHKWYIEQKADVEEILEIMDEYGGITSMTTAQAISKMILEKK